MDVLNTHVNFGVSASDVLLHSSFSHLPRNPVHPKFNDVRELHKVLHQLGLDTSLEVVEVQCTHRNLQKQVVTCLMFRGAERTDKAWLNSGCASIEALKASTNDLSLRKELDYLSRQ